MSECIIKLKLKLQWSTIPIIDLTKPCTLFSTIIFMVFKVLYFPRFVFLSPYKRFEVKYQPKNSETQIVGVFNDVQRKRLTLPMPPKGWNCTTMTFISKDGKSYKFLFDGVKE